MTSIELEARKALLVREILTEINSEEMLDKLFSSLKRIRKSAAVCNQVPPCQYTVEEMKGLLVERQQNSLFHTQDEVTDRMNKLMASWNQ